jgi:hypothetical protein
MRDVILLGAMLVLGAHLSVHGAEKSSDHSAGPGLDKGRCQFHAIGLTPGKPMAA